MESNTLVPNENKNGKIKKCFNWISKNIYLIFHLFVLISLTIYIILNWELCISMQFFSQFNGNNILFIVWIVLLFLIVYDVEGNGIKLKRHKTQEEFENARMLHSIEVLAQNGNQMKNDYQNGGVSDGSSD